MPGAAHVMAWGQRMRNLPGPLGPVQGASQPGVPFLPDYVTGYLLAAQIGPGADLTAGPNQWNLFDVTTDVEQANNITIVLGRGNEQSTTASASCTFTLDNRSGNYSTRRPESIYWPNMRVGFPVRVQIYNAAQGVFEQFAGYADDLASGRDTSGQYATVVVTAHGVLNRFAQGDAPLAAALVRASLATNPAAFWAMDDGTTALTFASGLSGGQAITVATGPGGFGNGTPPAGMTAVPDLTGTVLLRGTIPITTAVANGGWSVGFAFNVLATGVGAQRSIMQVQTDNGLLFQFLIADGTPTSGNIGLEVAVLSTDGTINVGLGGSTSVSHMDGQWHYAQYTFTKTGTNMSATLYLDGVSWGAHSSGVFLITPGNPTSFQLGYIPAFDPTVSVSTFSVCALSFWPNNAVHPISSAVSAYTGELATDRLTRLGNELGIPVTIVGTSTRTMGPQPIAGPIELLRECEAVDGGVLEDGIGFGLRLSTNDSRYNQPAALTPTLNQMAPLMDPVENNLLIRNDVTVSRSGGSSGRYVQPAGQPYAPGAAGTFYDAATLNVPDDSTLASRAQWFVHRGTVDADRYPAFSFNFAVRTSLIPAWLLLSNGSRIAVTGNHANAGLAADVVQEGWAVTLSRFLFSVTANVSPSDPWQVGVLESVTSPFKIDSDDSTVTADMTTATTAIAVSSTVPWTTTAAYPADFPFAAYIDGEDVTVTAIVVPAFDAFGRVTANGLGTADSGQVWGTAGSAPAASYSTNGTVAQHAMGTVNVSNYSFITSPAADIDLYLSCATDALALGNSQYTHLFARYLTNQNWYAARLDFSTTQTVTLQIRSNVASVETALATLVLPGVTHAANTFYRIRLRLDGPLIRAKAWPVAQNEPIDWQVTATDTSFNAAGSIGFRSILSAANTNVLPVTASYDDFTTASPRNFTITRAAGGTSARIHLAGTPIKLYRPAAIAL